MKRLFKWLYAFLWPLVLLTLSESMIRGSLGAFGAWLALARPGAVIINYVCYFTLVNVFQFIRRKNMFVLSQVLVSAFCLIYAAVSYYKELLRMEPVLPSDVKMLGNGLDMAAAYVPHFYLLMWGAIALVAAGTAFVLIRFRRGRRGGRLWPLWLPAFALCVVITLYAALGGGFIVRQWATASYVDRYSLVSNTRYNGTAFHLLEYMAQHHTAAKPPEGYSREAMAELMREEVPEAPEMLPNVIFILGESMVDVTRLTGLSLLEDSMPNIRRLMADNPSGFMTVHTFGGGTHIAETAVLTGLYTDAYIPLRMDSLAWRLKPLGYRATALHSYWGWFYDRSKHLKDMGFDQFIPLEGMTGTPVFAPYPQDALLYDQALEALQASEGRDFLYVATMQTHGGYDFEMMYDKKINQTALPADAENELNNYLALQSRADAALNDFITALSELKEPTVVVYFGDHYPALPLTFAVLGYEQGEPVLYETPYFVWANFEMDFSGGNLENDALSAQVMEALHLPTTLYQRLRYTPQKRQMASYDALYGRNYAWEADGMAVNEGYVFAREPKLTEVTVTGDNGLVLRGEDITWRVIVDYGGAYELVILQTDGKTAYAEVSDSLAAALRNGGQGRILFVDDAEKAFAIAAVEEVKVTGNSLKLEVGE